MSTPTGRRWKVVAAALLVVGTLLSVFGARVTAQSDADRSRRSFETNGEQIASNLKVAVRHEEDLLASARALVMHHPGMTSADVARWISLARVLERYPALEFMGLLVPVPRDQLVAFSALATTGVPGPSDPDAVSPPGERPFYCLLQASMARTIATPPPGVDYCVGSAGASALSVRDSGEGSYLPVKIGEDTWFVVQTPVYHADAPVGTVAERRAAFIGWFGTGVDIGHILDEALEGFDGVTVTMAYQSDSAHATYRPGPSPHPRDSYAIDFGNGWTATVHRPAVTIGILDSGQALILLVGGIAISALLAGLILMQGTGRARAEYQSLHDGLSGLPNRVLVADRAERLVARSQRNRTQGAALFVDIDGFKSVNDTFGHDAGDRLLVAVAGRLTSAVRHADTIGRIGGDEFVILIERSPLDTAPELVAQRLLDVLRAPFVLDRGEHVRVSASVGIAIGDRSTGAELIDDADIAMYHAKRAGKDRYAVFHPEMRPTSRDRVGALASIAPA